MTISRDAVKRISLNPNDKVNDSRPDTACQRAGI